MSELNNCFHKVSSTLPPILQDICIFDEIVNNIYTGRIRSIDNSVSGEVYLEIYLPNKDTKLCRVSIPDFLNYYQWSYVGDVIKLIDTIY